MKSPKEVVNSLNLGVSRKALAAEVNSPLHALLIGLNQEIIDRLNASITGYDVIASNRLKQSIITVDDSQPGVLSVAISAEFYWKYVNYGVNGTKVNHGAPSWGTAPGSTMSFKDSILGWIRDKGLQARPGQTYDQMAFAIMRGVKENGMKPRPFFTDVVNQELKTYLTKTISEVIKQAIIIEITEPKWQ
jgi:hypothetical protein